VTLDLGEAGLVHIITGEEAAIPADRMLDRGRDVPDRLPAKVTTGLMAVEGQEKRLP
jgi:hypothetical protein